MDVMSPKGKVNEKERLQQVVKSSFDPRNNKAHLYHSIEGLERYPNYLSRWQSLDDIDKLEDALLGLANKVREQKKSILNRREVLGRLVEEIVHNHDESGRWSRLLKPPTDWDMIRQKVLDPQVSAAVLDSQGRLQDEASVREVLSGSVNMKLKVEQLVNLLDEELSDVYSFPLLSPEFCADVASYHQFITHLVQQHPTWEQVLGRRPLDLDDIGLRWVSDLLFNMFLKPITTHLFQESEASGLLDWRQGYIAAYKAGTQRDNLVTHTDDSEVTLNICLGEKFEGGDLEFHGLRGTSRQAQSIGSYEPQIGSALIHAGRHFHRVTPVTDGSRFALIVWARSWQGVRSQSCQCCWLNRRRDDTCVCGARWN